MKEPKNALKLLIFEEEDNISETDEAILVAFFKYLHTAYSIAIKQVKANSLGNILGNVLNEDLLNGDIKDKEEPHPSYIG